MRNCERKKWLTLPAIKMVTMIKSIVNITSRTFFASSYFKLMMVFLFAICNVAAAQEETEWEQNAGEIQNVEIEIVKERENAVPEANRNFEKIPPRPAESIRPTFEYNLQAIPFSSPDFTPVVRPLKLKQEELSKIYGNMVSAGFGNYSSPYLEAYVNTKRNKDRFYGAHFYHRSFGRGPVDGKNSGSGNTQLDAFGKFFGKKITTGASFDYENRTTHFYGYPAGTEPDREDIRQSYNTFAFNGGIENAKPADLNYSFDAGFSYLQDRYDARESELSLKWHNDYTIDDLSGFTVDVSYFLMAREDEFVEADPRHLLRVNPAYQFRPVEDLAFSMGLNVVYENDRIGDKDIHVYPDVRVDYHLAEAAHLFAHLDGDIERVSLHTLSRENLWVAPNINIQHTNRSLQITGGIKGKAVKKLAYEAGFSLASLKNLYFYQNGSTDISKFDVIYDNGDTKRLNFFVDAGLTFSEDARMSLRADWFGYDTENIAEAWHRPTYRWTTSAYVNIYDKLSLNTSLILQGGMKAFNPVSGGVVDLDAAADLSAQLNYFWSKRFSVFLQINNMFAQEYPLYFNYPARGFQGMVGCNWSF